MLKVSVRRRLRSCFDAVKFVTLLSLFCESNQRSREVTLILTGSQILYLVWGSAHYSRLLCAYSRRMFPDAVLFLAWFCGGVALSSFLCFEIINIAARGKFEAHVAPERDNTNFRRYKVAAKINRSIMARGFRNEKLCPLTAQEETIKVSSILPIIEEAQHARNVTEKPCAVSSSKLLKISCPKQINYQWLPNCNRKFVRPIRYDCAGMMGSP